jgi:hypothetical protein
MDRTTTAQNQLWELPKELRMCWAPNGQMRHRIRICIMWGEGLTNLLRSTCVCLDSICDSFHKSKYLSFLLFCRRIPTSQLTILQNFKQFKLVNLYLQGFEDWSCGHWRTYLTWFKISLLDIPWTQHLCNVALERYFENHCGWSLWDNP